MQVSRGVKIHNIYYWTSDDTFRDPTVEGTQVPVRYDPFDAGMAYAFVRGQWHMCISEHYTRFQGRTMSEIRLASAEVRQRLTRHNGGATVRATARQIADHLAAMESTEATLVRLRAAETRRIATVISGDGDLPGGFVSPTDTAAPGDAVLVSAASPGITTVALDDATDDEADLCTEYV